MRHHNSTYVHTYTYSSTAAHPNIDITASAACTAVTRRYTCATQQHSSMRTCQCYSSTAAAQHSSASTAAQQHSSTAARQHSSTAPQQHITQRHSSKRSTAVHSSGTAALPDLEQHSRQQHSTGCSAILPHHRYCSCAVVLLCCTYAAVLALQARACCSPCGSYSPVLLCCSTYAYAALALLHKFCAALLALQLQL